MKRNKSSELVNTAQTAKETEPAGGPNSNPIDQLLDKADQAVRQGKVQESRDHLTSIFEHIANKGASRVPAHGDPEYGNSSYRMRQTA